MGIKSTTSVILSGDTVGFTWMFEQPMRMGIAAVRSNLSDLYVMIQRIGQKPTHKAVKSSRRKI